jgi:hypothetical protein
MTLDMPMWVKLPKYKTSPFHNCGIELLTELTVENLDRKNPLAEVASLQSITSSPRAQALAEPDDAVLVTALCAAPGRGPVRSIWPRSQTGRYL